MEKDSVVSYISGNIAPLITTFLIGIIVGVLFYKLFTRKTNKSIADMVMVISFIIAVGCLVCNLFFDDQVKSSGILSFFSSFIFSWLLTKKNSKEEYKEQQQEIAKTTYRHIGDIKSATLVTRNRLIELKDKQNIDSRDIDGILDDIEIILRGIKTNEEDWKDMLSDEYIAKMAQKEDPENDLGDERKEIAQPESSNFESVMKNLNNDRRKYQ